jgi:hypothetical protein
MNEQQPLDIKWIDEMLERNDPTELEWAQNVLNQWMNDLEDDEYQDFMDGVSEGVVSEHHMGLFVEFAQSKREERSLWDTISEIL